MVGRLLRRVGRPLGRELYYGRGPRLMSELRRRWLLFTHPHADIRFEGPVHIGPGFKLHAPNTASFIVGPGVEFRRNFRAELAPGAQLRVGGGTAFTYDCLIQCSSSIEVGERCGLGQSLAVFDGNHRYKDPTKGFFEQGYDLRPVRIGDDCAVLSKTTIVADVGDHCVIGANSIVTKPIPPFSVAGGVPARVIEQFGPEAGGDSDGDEAPRRTEPSQP